MMLNVPEIIEGGNFLDDRGKLLFINKFDFQDIKRFYQVENHNPSIIRAFHGHKHERKYVFVPRGEVLIICVPLSKFEEADISTANISRYVLSSEKPQILKIPQNYANGFRVLSKETIIQFFSDKTVEESAEDDFRFNWDHFGRSIWETKNR